MLSDKQGFTSFLIPDRYAAGARAGIFPLYKTGRIWYDYYRHGKAGETRWI
jgi:hypothetical protein